MLTLKHNKTRRKNIRSKKDKNYTSIKCVAVLQPDKSIPGNNVNGSVIFSQNKKSLTIDYEIYNLNDGEHGFHIHKCGDLTQSCKSACDHFNPYNNDHGGLTTHNSHAGDLGNITSNNKIAKGTIRTDKITLHHGKTNIIGRMIIVHEDRDDLGRGDNEESLKTGNAGSRLACGVIGIKN